MFGFGLHLSPPNNFTTRGLSAIFSHAPNGTISYVMSLWDAWSSNTQTEQHAAALGSVLPPLDLQSHQCVGGVPRDQRYPLRLYPPCLPQKSHMPEYPFLQGCRPPSALYGHVLTLGAGVPTRGTSYWGHPLRVERRVLAAARARLVPALCRSLRARLRALRAQPRTDLDR
jgi:hypothetical protein